MLAQQAGSTNCDQNSRQPVVAVCTGFVLMGALLFVLLPPKGQATSSSATRTGFVSLAPEAPQREPEPVTVVVPRPVSPTMTPNLVPLPPPKPQSTSTTTSATFGTMRGLGRSLFGDYLFAVELAGTLLLVASIGAIVIAPKRSSGKL